MELTDEDLERIKKQAQHRIEHKKVSRIEDDEQTDIDGSAPAAIAEQLRSRTNR